MSAGEGERSDSLCAEAEVVQGSTRIDDKRVTVSLEPGASQGQWRLRVRSAAVVDEPFVQLRVRAGCEATSTRDYVLLADMPGATASSITAPAAGARAAPAAQREQLVAVAAALPEAHGDQLARASPAGPVRPARASASTARPRSDDRAGRRRPMVRASPVRPAAAPAIQAVAQARIPASADARVPKAAPAANGSRLQLDSLDPVSVRSPALAASTAAAPLARSADPALATALPPASAPPATGELQHTAERMQALEATLAALREQSAQNQRLLLEMRGELDQARESRHRNPLVYALALLLLFALAALGLLWSRTRGNVGLAWSGNMPTDRDDGTSSRRADAQREAEDEPAFHNGPSGAPVSGAASFASPIAALQDSGFGDASDTLLAAPVPGSDAEPARYVNTEELFDVQQQSDFFVSLGQHDQAIAVLSEHIAGNPETSALAYLDLLRIYHSLDRRDDYASVAWEFGRVFNAAVPAFDQFAEVGKGLDHYRTTLARIEAQWPAPATLNLIEELVFRKPGASGGESFDLAAYQELLLLYSVAKEVIDPDSGPYAPTPPPLDAHGADVERTAPAARTGQAAAPRFAGNGNRMAEFDDTVVTTIPGHIQEEFEISAWPAPPVSPTEALQAGPLADLDLFDPATEAEIAPRPVRRRR